MFACFIAATGVIARASHIEPVPVRTAFEQFPMQIGDWRGTSLPPFADSIMAVLGSTITSTASTTRRTSTAPGLYIGYYRSQRQGDSIHSPLNCMPGAGWEPVSQRPLSITVPNAGRDD